MNAKEVLDTIKLMFVETSTEELSNEVNETTEATFAEAKLVDGTIVYTEGDLVEGATLYIKTDDEEDPFAPEGVHELEDEKTLVTVGENGEIIKIENKEEEVEDMKEHEDKKEEMSTAEFAAELKGILEPLVNEINTLKGELSTLTERFEKVASEPAAKKIRNNFSADEKNTMFERRFETLLKIKNGK